MLVAVGDGAAVAVVVGSTTGVEGGGTGVSLTVVQALIISIRLRKRAVSLGIFIILQK